MHLLLTEINWDTDGEDCDLPANVIVLDVPQNWELDTIENSLSNCFGFCHNGYQWEVLGTVHDSHAGGGQFLKHLATMRYPE
jgi:hypothetical protein